MGSRGGGTRTRNRGGSSGGAAPAAAGVSNARVQVDPDYTPAEAAKLRGTFSAIVGRKVTDRDIASLVGAPDDATVTIAQGSGLGSPEVDIHVKGPGIDTMIRTVRTDKQGRTYIKNEYIRLTETGTGLGARILAKQVEAASRLGIHSLRAEAARDSAHVGYSVWAKLGYNAKLTKTMRANLPEGLKGARSLHELTRTPEGMKWWEQHGTSINVRFNLAPGSRSRRILSAYMKARGRQ